MRHLPTILALLSLPAGAIAYTLTVQPMSSTTAGQSQDVLVLIAALFVAGLVMLPFLIPFFDRKAKRDLAEYRSTHPEGTREPAEQGADDDETSP